jgi:hypothetical protein
MFEEYECDDEDYQQALGLKLPSDPPEVHRNGPNLGEMAEMIARNHIALGQPIYSATKKMNIEYEALWVGNKEFPRFDRYPGTPKYAQLSLNELLESHIRSIKAAARRPNKDAIEVSSKLRIPHGAAPNTTKVDLKIEVRKDVKHGYSLKGLGGSPPSLVNASSLTRVTFEVLKDGSSIGVSEEYRMLLDQYGNLQNRVLQDHGLKWFVQELYQRGYTLGKPFAKHKGFREATNSFFQELACLCLLFLRGNENSLEKLASTYTEETGVRDFSGLHRYVKNCFLYSSPTSLWVPEEHVGMTTVMGMILFDPSLKCHQHPFTLYEDVNDLWWANLIRKWSVFDTPSRDRNDFGYIHEGDGNEREGLFLDYALCIRGCKNLSTILTEIQL